MPEPAKRVAKNAPGDFFVHQDQCIACQICVDMAPELMGYDRSERFSTCYFSIHPSSSAELERALEAYASCCIGAVDYEGNNPDILKRIAEIDAKYRKHWSIKSNQP